MGVRRGRTGSHAEEDWSYSAELIWVQILVMLDQGNKVSYREFLSVEAPSRDTGFTALIQGLWAYSRHPDGMNLEESKFLDAFNK